MPIIGLTDRASLKPRLPRLGKLRKGGEKPQGGGFGKDLDHFRFTSDNPKVVEAFTAAYGPEPRIVNCVMFYDTAEENFESWIECWDATGMVYRSDKENYLVWRDGDHYSRTPKPHVDTKDQFEVGRLTILIPEIIQAGFVGTVTMETHSNNDLRHITGVLYAAEQQHRGLRGTQCVLRRVQESIGTPGFGKTAGKRTRTDKWLVKLEMPQQLWTVLDAPADTPQLEDGIDTVTGEIIEEEEHGTFVLSTEPMPRPQEPKHAEGAGPTQPTDKRPSANMLAAWDDLWGEANALDMFVQPIAGDATATEVARRGAELREQIAQRKADLAAAQD